MRQTIRLIGENMHLLVTLSIPRPNLKERDYAHIFIGGRIEIIDWEKRECIRRIDYVSSPEHLGQGYSMRFTGGCLHDGQWFQAAGTEVVVYSLPDWSVHRVISFPSFNDLHGVKVIGNEIGVINTGLEMFQILSLEGEIVREFNAAATPTWERFDRSIDYRRFGSTKPHTSQINNAFKIDGQWWLTRCLGRDAVNVEDGEDRIPIAVGQPHDGLVRGDFIYFTTTNAHIVVARASTRKVEEVIDLNALLGKGRKMGWCRGLEVKGETAYVGFTRLRRSKWHGLFDAAKDSIRGRKGHSFIQKVDLRKKVLVDSYDYQLEASPEIFTIADFGGEATRP
jgi:hypothetical protein